MGQLNFPPTCVYDRAKFSHYINTCPRPHLSLSEKPEGPTTRKIFSYSLTVYILLDMAGGHGKRALSAEELERQRKEREDEELEDLRRRIQEDDDIPEHVYRYHI